MRDNLPLWKAVGLHLDQGHTFESKLGMDKTWTTPYHPQAAGQVERFDQTLAALLSTIVALDQKD